MAQQAKIQYILLFSFRITQTIHQTEKVRLLQLDRHQIYILPTHKPEHDHPLWGCCHKRTHHNQVCASGDLWPGHQNQHLQQALSGEIKT